MNSDEYYYSDSESDFNFTHYDINEYIESFVTENTKNDASRLFLDVFYTTTFLVGIIGNMFVLILNSIGNDRIAANPSTKGISRGIISLAVANLFHLMSIPFLIIPKQKQLSIGVIGCKILRSNDYISFLASTLILALLSLDRFGLICFAQNSLVKRLLRISWLKCFACLLLSMLFALPMIIFSEYDSTTKDCIVRFPDHNNFNNSLEFSANMTDLKEIGYCHKILVFQ